MLNSRGHCHLPSLKRLCHRTKLWPRAQLFRCWRCSFLLILIWSLVLYQTIPWFCPLNWNCRVCELTQRSRLFLSRDLRGHRHRRRTWFRCISGDLVKLMANKKLATRIHTCNGTIPALHYHDNDQYRTARLQLATEWRNTDLFSDYGG